MQENSLPPESIMKKVESSQIEAIGHEPTTNTLFIQFKKGSVYSYGNVDADLHKRFMESESQGSFFYKHIKPFAKPAHDTVDNQYPFHKLRSNVEEAEATA